MSWLLENEAIIALVRNGDIRKVVEELFSHNFHGSCSNLSFEMLETVMYITFTLKCSLSDVN